jgi:hypothetical protein
MAEPTAALTADVVFERLEQLRELLRLTDHLRGYHRVASEGAASGLERATAMGHPVVVLYRPAGPAEIELVRSTAFTRWPPRRDEQPIFYPVTNEQYAREIAEQWNLREDGVAFVTRFRVRAAILDQYPVHVVGASHHEELWVPAEQLEAFNDAIVGPIEIVARLEPGG